MSDKRKSIRGGAWFYGLQPRACPHLYRSHHDPNLRILFIGFRCVRSEP
jgi:formylglycine-generating enzyme required for sulfatase activity